MSGVVGVTGVGLALPGVRSAADLLGPRPAGASAVVPAQRIPKKGLRYKDWATQLAHVAVHDALADAGLRPNPDLTVPPQAGLTVPGPGVGVVVSTNFGNVDTVCRVKELIDDKTTDGVSPMDLPFASSNATAADVAIRFGLGGVNLTVCNGATSGLDALWLAVGLLRAGRVRQAVVVGVEPDNDHVRKLLGLDRPGDGAAVVDGAVAVVLEREDGADERRRGFRTVLGAFARRADRELCATAVAAASGGPALRLEPGEHDLEALWGAAGGALGLLQCAAATAWFDGGNAGPVHAFCGGPRDDASALLVLDRPGARP